MKTGEKSVQAEGLKGLLKKKKGAIEKQEWGWCCYVLEGGDTEKYPLNWKGAFKTEEWSGQLHKVQLWSLLWVTYRQDQADRDPEALHASKRGKGGFKGAKAKNRISYEGRGLSAPTGTRVFFLSLGFLTINHLCQQKVFFQFSYQMKAREKVDGELIWLGHIPHEQAKPAHAERRGDGTAGLSWNWQSGVSVAQPHCSIVRKEREKGRRGQKEPKLVGPCGPEWAMLF